MSVIRNLGLLSVTALFVSIGPVLADGDATRGQKIFNKCKVCHALKAGQKRIGPSLHGVIGRRAGSESYFGYSPAMRSAGIDWTEENLDKYLEAPKKFIPKNKMPFAGLKKAKDRADVIAYLKTVSN
jgi:cytochrome c2